MIKRYIQYTKEHKEKIRKAYKDFTKPQYLGEDEMIAVRALSKEQALEKIRKEEMTNADKTRQEVEEEIKLEEISIGWLHLVNPSRDDHKHLIDECEEYVSFEEESDYPVFVYTI